MRTAELVEKALKTYPITRSSDRHLIAAVWYLQDSKWNDYGKEFLLKEAIMPESITRHRRKLQEQGLYRATERVEEERYSKFKEVRGGNLSLL
jgi:hypothetical protein